MPKKVIMGIYKITNLKNGKFYIGSSNNIYSRWKDHVNDLRKNKHGNSYLQNAWNKHGEDSFHFEIIHIAGNTEELVPLEQVYLDMLTPWKRKIGYNISMYSDCALRGRKRPMSSRIKQSKVVRGENNHFFGKNHSEATKALLSETHKGLFTGDKSSTAKLTWDDVRNIREIYKTKSFKEISKMYDVDLSAIKYIIWNKTWVDENYQRPSLDKKMIKARQQANQIRFTKPVVMLDKDTGKFIREFSSTKEAAEYFGRNKGGDISAVCRGRQVSAYGYKWMYKNKYQQTS